MSSYTENVRTQEVHYRTSDIHMTIEQFMMGLTKTKLKDCPSVTSIKKSSSIILRIILF